MQGQAYDWTCSVCSTTWVLQSTGVLDPYLDVYAARQRVGYETGYPSCVNETYGSMSPQCIVDELARYGLNSQQAWVTFDQAYSIMSATTGTINPQGMYHYMGIRGVRNGNLWVANSAQGYDGIYDDMSRSAFNSLGPVSIIYLVP